MAGADIRLNRLCDLQVSKFEIVDCQVKEKDVV